MTEKVGLRLGFSLVPRGEFSIILAGVITMNSHDYPLKSLTGVYVLLSAIFGSILIKESEWFIKWFLERRNGWKKIPESGTN